MGSFYGSIVVRSNDRGRVQRELETIARGGKRFLLGPVRNGWIAIYPSGSGQDLTVAQQLAERVDAELIAMLVHDDDVFAYEYFRDGKKLDQYDSDPDYFAQETPARKRELRGKPELLRHLARDEAALEAVAERLRPEAEKPVFASDLMEAFTAALGIPEAMNSYEDLIGDDEHDEGADELIHIPDLTPQKERRRRENAARSAEKARRMRDGHLLWQREWNGDERATAPVLCPSPDGRGFIVVLARLDRQTAPLELLAPPWTAELERLEASTGSGAYGMELSPSGRYLAVGHASGNWMASLWDLRENRLVGEVPQVRVTSCVGFSPDDLAMLSVSSDGTQGRITITSMQGSTERALQIDGVTLATAHPSGGWLAAADRDGRLHAIDLSQETVRSTHYAGGRYQPTAIEAALAARVKGSTIDYDALEKQVRTQAESMLQRLGSSGLAGAGLPPGLVTPEKLKALLESNLQASLQNMRAVAAQSLTAVDVDKAAERVFAIKFDSTGEHLCVATSKGVRVYRWHDLLDAAPEQLRPVIAIDPGATGGSAVQGTEPSYVYALELDAERNRLLFAGTEGNVRFVDLASGTSGLLLEPPGAPSITRLVLSRDRAALALIGRPQIRGRSVRRPPAEGPTLQVWDYRVLSRDVR